MRDGSFALRVEHNPPPVKGSDVARRLPIKSEFIQAPSVLRVRSLRLPCGFVVPSGSLRLGDLS